LSAVFHLALNQGTQAGQSNFPRRRLLIGCHGLLLVSVGTTDNWMCGSYDPFTTTLRRLRRLLWLTVRASSTRSRDFAGTPNSQ
jgi:hypothetical protein